MTGLIDAVNIHTGKPALIPAHYLTHPTFGKNYRHWEHGKKTLLTPAASEPRKESGARDAVTSEDVEPTEPTKPRRGTGILAKKED